MTLQIAELRPLFQLLNTLRVVDLSANKMTELGSGDLSQIARSSGITGFGIENQFSAPRTSIATKGASSVVTQETKSKGSEFSPG